MSLKKVYFAEYNLGSMQLEKLPANCYRELLLYSVVRLFGPQGNVCYRYIFTVFFGKGDTGSRKLVSTVQKALSV